MNFTLSVALDELLSRLNVGAAAVLLLEQSTRRLRYLHGSGFRGEGIKTTNLGLGEGLPRIAALTKKRYTERHFTDILPSIPRAEVFRDEGFYVYHAVPLFADGTLIGVLEIFERSAVQHDPQWFHSLEVLAAQIGAGLGRPEKIADF